MLSAGTTVRVAGAAALAVICAATPARAACFVCDTVIALAPPLAACFEENIDAFLSRAEAAPLRRIEVNLAFCGSGRNIDHFPSAADLERQGAQRLAEAEAEAAQQVSFFLDADQIACAKTYLQTHDVTDGMVLDFDRECG